MRAPRLSARAERGALAVLSVCAFLILAGPTGLNPDGLEMIALSRAWLGAGPPLPAGGYWPPLWPALVAALSPVFTGLEAGRWLNLVLAGLVVLPLHALVTTLAGAGAARVAVLLYVSLPAVREHAVVLDARVLGGFLAVSAAAWAVEAAAIEAAAAKQAHNTAEPEGRLAWSMAGLCAGLMALSRPEGLLFPPLLALAAMSAQGSRRLRLLRAGALLATVLPALLRPGAEVRVWESYTGPWLGIWPSRDLVALFGANSAPTAYRDFVVAAGEAGLGRPGIPWTNLLSGAPEGLQLLGAGLPAATGALLLVLAAFGGMLLGGRSRRSALLLGAIGGLLVPVVLLPQARDQATAATNLMYLVPGLCALAAVALVPPGRVHPLSWAIALGLLAEAHLGPFRQGPPVFPNGSDMAETMRLYLRAHPPAAGAVAATLSTRGVVFEAALTPRPLPSGWEPWSAPEGVGVLLGSMDIRGADGGRGRMLIEDPAWEVRFVSFEGDVEAWALWLAAARAGHAPPELARHLHWMVYLERRE